MVYPSSSSQDVKVAIEAKSTNRSVRCFLMICCIVWLFFDMFGNRIICGG